MRRTSLLTLPPKTQEPQPPFSTASRPRLDFLDGLRALAAIWVVLSHLWIVEFGANAQSGLLGLLTNGILYSHLAVDAFIVLSGYCLILPVARTGELRGGALNFFRRRARRILPACYAALALSVGIYVWLHPNKPFPWTALAGSVLLLQDAVRQWGVFDSPLWSVAVEWRIYFLFPAIVVLLRRHGPLAVLAACAALGYGLTAAVFTWRIDFFLTCPWYLFLFALGVCAGWTAAAPFPDRVPRWRRISVGCALLTIYLIHRSPLTPSGGSNLGLHLPLIDAAAGAAVAAGLLVLHGNAASRARRLLSAPPLVRLGQMSYSLYLIHLPILVLIDHLLTTPHLLGAFSPLARTAALAALGLPVVGLATWGFYNAVERRFLRAPNPPAR